MFVYYAIRLCDDVILEMMECIVLYVLGPFLWFIFGQVFLLVTVTGTKSVVLLDN